MSTLYTVIQLHDLDDEPPMLVPFKRSLLDAALKVYEDAPEGEDPSEAAIEAFLESLQDESEGNIAVRVLGTLLDTPEMILMWSRIGMFGGVEADYTFGVGESESEAKIAFVSALMNDWV